VAVAASGDCLGPKEKIGNVEGKFLSFGCLKNRSDTIEPKYGRGFCSLAYDEIIFFLGYICILHHHANGGD
jgi:hypothetical protein